MSIPLNMRSLQSSFPAASANQPSSDFRGKAEEEVDAGRRARRDTELSAECASVGMSAKDE